MSPHQVGLLRKTIGKNAYIDGSAVDGVGHRTIVEGGRLPVRGHAGVFGAGGPNPANWGGFRVDWGAAEREEERAVVHCPSHRKPAFWHVWGLRKYF